MTGLSRPIEKFVPAAPGCRRDIDRATELAVELPFFNDEAAAETFLRAAVAPLVPNIPERCLAADLGGADGFLADRLRTFLAVHGRIADVVVVDANIRFLMTAQGRGLSVRPANLETLELRGASLMTMRLVNHYNGIRRQQAIIDRARSNLAPGGYLVIQAEVGTWAQCAFRSIVSDLLSGGSVADRGEGCRWLPVDALCRMMKRAGLPPATVDPSFMKFDSNLRKVLQLAWNRVNGAPVESVAEKARAAFVEKAYRIAEARFLKNDRAGFSPGDDGELRFMTQHTLITARAAK